MLTLGVISDSTGSYKTSNKDRSVLKYSVYKNRAGNNEPKRSFSVSVIMQGGGILWRPAT